MTPELWKRLNPLFNAAVEKPADERPAFIAQACGDDSELRRELIALLEAHEKDGSTLENVSQNIKGLPAKARSAFSTGEVLLGRFRIVRMLGSGGMGDVYQAYDIELSQSIALKLIRPGILADSASLSRFKREVQLARRLSGPNICRIHELFVTGDSSAPAGAFLTMELLDGITLFDRIRQSGPIPWREAQGFANDICEGLAAMHGAGIIHRDLKSGNIMLANRSGSIRAVVMDFGLAHEMSRAKADGSSGHTLPDTVLGTPKYMAPEQFEGKEVTPATDLFAFGIVLYEMLTSQPPFPSSSLLGAAVLRGKRPGSASSIQPGVPHRLDFVIGKCLEYEPSRRFQSAEELARALRARYLTSHYQAMGRPWVVRFAGVIIAAVMVLGAAIWWQSRQYYHPDAKAERWYQEGLAALREGSYLKATLMLGNAIQQDSHFAMAHARLAEAWSNLDFDGAAQREMLIASAGESHVPALDRMYLDAIRATLTRDFNGALTNYQRILARLPESEKAVGYVDLGMAYERAGDPTHALESFKSALRQNVDSPAPYMQKAILETHLGNDQDANTDFDKAESLYKTEMNPEGQAESDYQRGYLANEREETEEANTYLQRALSESQHLPQPNVQLKIRALTQLSSVAYNSGEDDKAKEFANAAIQNARDYQLMSWAADGLVRLANTELADGNYSEADNHLRDALSLLGQTQQDRVLAMANLTLASLRNQQHRSTEVLAPARAAAAYYKANGYESEAGRATLLIGRAEREQGHWQDALQTARDLADLAGQSNSSDLLIQSEELQGGVYIDMEDYPHALEHYRIALSNAQNKPMRPYESLHCADVLWRMGQFEEAQKMIDSVRPTNANAGSIEVDSLLAQMRYSLADEKAKQLIRKFSNMSFGRMRDLTLNIAFAEAALGKAALARRDLASLLGSDGMPKTENGEPMDPGDLATFEVAAARVYLANGESKIAFDEAVRAESYFESKHLDDSELRSSLLAAQTAKSLHDAASYKSFSKKVVDIQAELSRIWPSPELHSYISRPDLKVQFNGIAR